MAFALKSSETFDSGIKRILHHELGDINDQLSSIKGNKKTPFHEARKGLKKCRSALRLIRPDIGETAFRRENTACRDVARLASEIRDAQVMVDTFDELMDHYPNKIGSDVLEPIRREIRKRASRRIEESLQRPSQFRKARADLKKSDERIAHLRLEEKGWDSIETGMFELYRQGRKKYRRAEKGPSDTSFHEWRKTTKYLRHGLELVEGSWPNVLGETTKELHALGDLLGADHDLTMLREELEKKPSELGGAKKLEPLIALIDRRQQELRQQALVSGEKLFAEKPGAFIKRLHHYYNAWRKLAAPDKAEA